MFEYDTTEYYISLLDEKITEVWLGCKEAGENERLPWFPYDLTRAKKIWMDFMELGFVRDIKGLERMAKNFVEKIATIEAITILGGHTQQNPEDYLDSLEIEFDEETEEKLADYIIDDEGQYRLSDYALEPLCKLAGKIIEAKTPEDKLLFLDQVLNVVHQRSDIASWFVKGGRDSLDELQNQGRDPKKIT
jgi:hypothetical protein